MKLPFPADNVPLDIRGMAALSSDAPETRVAPQNQPSFPFTNWGNIDPSGWAQGPNTNQQAAQISAAMMAARNEGYGVINPGFLSPYDRNQAQMMGGGAAVTGAPAGSFMPEGMQGPIRGAVGQGASARAAYVPQGLSPNVALTTGPSPEQMQAYRNKMNPITPDMTPSQVAQAQIARDPTGAAKEFLMSTQKVPVSPSQELNQRLATGASAFSNIQPWLSKKGYGGAPDTVGLNDMLDEELVGHPIFSKLRQTDPDKAEAVYQSFNGRSLQGDLAAHHDIVQTQQKGFNDFTKDQLAKGASPNPFTGKWMVANDVEIPDILAPGGKRMTRQMMPATVQQEHMLNKGYYPVMGRDLPTAAPTAQQYLAKGETSQAGLAPEQLAKYNEHVTAMEKLKGGKLNPVEEGRARLLARQDVSPAGGFMGTMAQLQDFYSDVWNRTGGQYHPATSISPQALASSPLRGFAAPMAAPAGGLEGLARGMSMYPQGVPAPTVPAQLLGRGGLPVPSPAMQAAIAAGPDQMMAPPVPPFGNRPTLSRIIKPYERLGPYALQSLQRVSAQPSRPFSYNPSLANPAATAADLAYR